MAASIFNLELETCVLAINLLLRFFGLGAGFTHMHSIYNVYNTSVV